ncbi:ClpXP protease specificity-enhancing factor [Glaciecola sp. SC05]|uniref:ClpXP protease specificity-enhancing factor n=1 Tax=Glaciecola sp. SC05 TaxID=1987355 RepID=UPI0035289FDA
MQGMSSNQPYLLKAFFDWIIDNGMTPYMVIDTSRSGVEVPHDFVKDNQIVLNVSPNACVNFYMDLTQITFQARFGGQPMLIKFPSVAVTAIYAKENGAGTVFTPAMMGTEEPEPNKPESPKPKANGPGKKASLRVVK